jgi:hypothetical protein
MGGECVMYGKNSHAYRILRDKVKERDHLQVVGVD